MKKVKIMLMAILIMAIAGGALAFKANWGSQFCVVQPILLNGQYTCADEFGLTLWCKNVVLDHTTTDKGPTQNIRCTAEIDPVLECDIECPVLAITVHE